MKKASIPLLFFALFAIGASAASMQTDSTFPATMIANPSTGAAPLTVQFSVNSTTQITGYSWDFNGDNIVDSTSSNPTFTYTSPGNYLAKVNVTDSSGNVAVDTKSITVATSISISISANPSTGAAPLSIQFNAVATGQEPLQYNWDFNGDNIIDDNTQNPKLTLNTPGTYPIKLTVIDGTGNSATKTVNVTVTLSQVNIELESYFPKSVESGDPQTITFIIKNTGDSVLSNIDGKLIGNGIQYQSSTKIDVLNPGDQDSLTITAKFLQSGNISATAKIADKSIPVKFAVNQGITYTKSDLQSQLNKLKSEAQKDDATITDKKAQGYIVDAAADNLKSAKSYLDKAEQYLLTNDLKNAKLNLDLAGSSLEDFNTSLSSAQKSEKGFAAWLHENALTITAVIAAIGALWGIATKVFGHAKKFHEKITTTLTEKAHKGKKKKEKKSRKKEHKSESKAEPSKEE